MSAHGFLAFAAAAGLILLAVSASANVDYNHYPYTADTWQKDVTTHTVVDIKTTLPIHECSNYCTIRGTSFG
jgi:hypothetical protein